MKRGFTLIELLAVILILAMLILVSSIAVTRITKGAKRDINEAEEKAIIKAAETYFVENMFDVPYSGCEYKQVSELYDEEIINIEDTNSNLGDMYVRVCAVWKEGESQSKITYKLTETTPYIGCFEIQEFSNSITITNYKNSVSIDSEVSVCPRDVIIPDTIKGKPVRTLATNSFNNKNLTSLKISNNVTTIGTAAFYQNNLTSVIIPDSVTSMGNAAFYQNQLTSVKISSGLTALNYNVFGKNLLTSIEIPSNITTIGGNVFWGNNIANLVIPNGVTSIGDNAFYCNELTELIIPDSVTTIGNDAFFENRLQLVEIGTGITSIGTLAFYSSTYPATINLTTKECGQNNLNRVKIDVPYNADLINNDQFGYFDTGKIAWKTN